MRSVSALTNENQMLVEIWAGFVRQGTSLHGWCTENGIDSHNARKAILGKWKGPKATVLVDRVRSVAGASGV
jgi:hypothetical protein